MSEGDDDEEGVGVGGGVDRSNCFRSSGTWGSLCMPSPVGVCSSGVLCGCLRLVGFLGCGDFFSVQWFGRGCARHVGAMLTDGDARSAVEHLLVMHRVELLWVGGVVFLK